ncbi:MAG: creatininase family protein [bacterium]|jgi:creatinine amidohydrolase|nr:creatininase family protein [bacterium]
MRPWKLLEVNYAYVKEHPYEVAVLPIGATEPHNLHLPYGTDAVCAERIGELICEKAYSLGANVCLLPCLPYGVDSNLMKFPMTMSLNPSTVDIIIRDIIVSLEAHGIKKLVILNGHGGNTFKQALREFYGKTQVFISLVDWWRVLLDRYGEIFENPDDHAGEMETSIGLHLFPELIELDQADDGAVRQSRFEAIRQGWAQITRPWHIVTKNAGVGDPRKASAEKGEKALQIVIDRISQYLKELSDAEMDDVFPY